MFIKRDIQDAIIAGATQIPVVSVIGPRQSGKSTLVKELFKHHTYIDMQDAAMFEFANQDPKGFLHSYKNEHGIIIDEAQYAPNLFAQIKVDADKDPRPGYYILSGSQNFPKVRHSQYSSKLEKRSRIGDDGLHEKISESLAGRVYFYTLLPLSIKELQQAGLQQESALEQICKGFYPRVYQPHMQAVEYYENYILTYVERDIRTIRNIDSILIFKKFMQLCAVRIGSTINFSDIAADCGISITTARSWLALLEASFILFLLPPYHNNLGKRITKTAKLYFYDVGLAAALMGLDAQALVQQRQIYGGLFENMIIVDGIKNFNAQNVRPMLSFYRDNNQKEIDLIIETKGKTIPVEIKASETVNSHFFDTATWFVEQLKTDERPIVIYGGDQTQTRTQGKLFPWHALAHVTQLISSTHRAMQ